MSEQVALQLKINDFEGPLDLLLFLVRKHKMELADIQILSIVDQYLAFLDNAKEPNWELASEFVEMAARLIYMKSVMLLPKHKEEQETLKEELQGQLIQYRLIREIVEVLKGQNGGLLKFVKEEQRVEVDLKYGYTHKSIELFDSYIAVQGKTKRRMPLEEKDFEKIVRRKMVSVSSQILHILRSFRKKQKIATGELFQSQDKNTAVATFLAILEMVKKKRIYFDKQDKYLYYNNQPKEQ